MMPGIIVYRPLDTVSRGDEVIAVVQTASRNLFPELAVLKLDSAGAKVLIVVPSQSVVTKTSITCQTCVSYSKHQTIAVFVFLR